MNFYPQRQKVNLLNDNIFTSFQELKISDEEYDEKILRNQQKKELKKIPKLEGQIEIHRDDALLETGASLIEGLEFFNIYLIDKKLFYYLIAGMIDI